MAVYVDRPLQMQCLTLMLQSTSLGLVKRHDGLLKIGLRKPLAICFCGKWCFDYFLPAKVFPLKKLFLHGVTKFLLLG